MKKLLITLLSLFFFSCTFAQTNYSQSELQEAITWMYDQGLTRYDTLKDYMPNSSINREQASKFFSLLATTVYDKSNVANTKCSFSDIKKADITLQQNIVNACKLGIFKGSNKLFNPKQKLTNAEALAVYTRLADYTPSENQKPRYKKYYDMILFRGKIDAEGLFIKDEGFATQSATRGEIAVMIYRTSKKLIDAKTSDSITDGGGDQIIIPKPIYQTESAEATLDPNLSIIFSHNFSDAPNISEADKSIIRDEFNLSFGNALNNLKSKGIINDTDINTIKRIPINHFEDGGAAGYCKTISKSSNGCTSNSFGGFGFLVHKFEEAGTMKRYYESAYLQTVFYHEIGHYIDLVKNQGAKSFWTICRNNTTAMGMGNMKSECTNNSFVDNMGIQFEIEIGYSSMITPSYYSKTSALEDFAETFSFDFYAIESVKNTSNIPNYNEQMNNSFFQSKISYMNSLINKTYSGSGSMCNSVNADEGVLGFMGGMLGSLQDQINTLGPAVEAYGDQVNQALNQNISGNTRQCFGYGPVKNQYPAKGYGIQTLNNGTWGACMLDRCSGGCQQLSGGCTLKQNSCFITRIACATGIHLGYKFLQDDLSYGTCIFTPPTCSATQHLDSQYPVCMNNTKSCYVEHGIGQQTRSNNTRGACSAVGCNTGYQIQNNVCVIIAIVPTCTAIQHIENNVCVNNTKSCAITNGIGQQTWSNNARGECSVMSCNNGYQVQNNICKTTASNTGDISIAGRLRAATNKGGPAQYSRQIINESICGIGYRLPSSSEFQDLLAIPMTSNIGYGFSYVNGDFVLPYARPMSYGSGTNSSYYWIMEGNSPTGIFRRIKIQGTCLSLGGNGDCTEYSQPTASVEEEELSNGSMASIRCIKN